MDFSIRVARIKDIPDITRLNAQLGYPEISEIMLCRFRRLRKDRRNHRVFVAVTGVAVAGAAGSLSDRSRNPVIGWVHIFIDRLLTVGPRAEIGGLVVDAAWRGRGVGSALVCRAEEWARERGISPLVIRTNVIRTGAHTFYDKSGYQLAKQSNVYTKEIC
jgi:GNAT superfamily N-acetyltransferase